jgi:ribonuclease P protein component
MARGRQIRTPHFVLHQWSAQADTATGPGFEKTPALFAGCHLGILIPKRWAKRAVTRNLIRRQVRAIAAEHPHLPEAQYVVRLKAPFDPRQFHSAHSEPLRQAVRQELLSLFAKVGVPS